MRLVKLIYDHVDSFGVECGRLAGLPESILRTAAAKASSFQIDVEQRKAENRCVHLP